MDQFPSIPLWLNLIVRLLPVPEWVKALVPAIWAIIKAIPKDKANAILAELHLASSHAVNTGDPTHLTQALVEQSQNLHRECVGAACSSEKISP